jgi:hypothetical protein
MGDLVEIIRRYARLDLCRHDIEYFAGELYETNPTVSLTLE